MSPEQAETRVIEVSDLIDRIYRLDAGDLDWHDLADHFGRFFGAPWAAIEHAAGPQVRALGLGGAALARATPEGSYAPCSALSDTAQLGSAYAFEASGDNAQGRAQEPVTDDGRRLSHGLAIHLAADAIAPGTELRIVLMRAAETARFADRDQSLLTSVASHFNRTLRRNRVAEATAARALDAVSSGLFIVNADGYVLHQNSQATRILANNPVLQVVDGRLEPEDRFTQIALLDAIREACEGHDEPLPSLSLARTETRLPLRLVVTPLPNATAHMHCAVWIIDPTRRAQPCSTWLESSFGLSQAEIRLTRLLATGMSVAEVASHLGVTTGTVRNQLKRVFDKTGIGRQADLIRIALSTCGPTDLDPRGA